MARVTLELMLTLKTYLEQAKREYILNALAAHQWDRGKAAKALGVTERAMFLYFRRYKIPTIRKARSAHG